MSNRPLERAIVFLGALVTIATIVGIIFRVQHIGTFGAGFVLTFVAAAVVAYVIHTES